MDIGRLASVICRVAVEVYEGIKSRIPMSVRRDAYNLVELVLKTALSDPIGAVIAACEGLCNLHDMANDTDHRKRKNLKSSPAAVELPDIDVVLESTLKRVRTERDHTRSMAIEWHRFDDMCSSIVEAVKKFELREDIEKTPEFRMGWKITHSYEVEGQLNLVDLIFESIKEDPKRFVSGVILFLENEAVINKMRLFLTAGRGLFDFLEYNIYSMFVLVD
jgi:hypothetical protein